MKMKSVSLLSTNKISTFESVQISESTYLIKYNESRILEAEIKYKVSYSAFLFKWTRTKVEDSSKRSHSWIQLSLILCNN